MPSWDYDPPVVPADPPDHVEAPEPYTDAEWATCEGASPREYHLVGRVVEIGGFEGHTTSATVRAHDLEEAIRLARASALERGVRTAGWIAL